MIPFFLIGSLNNLETFIFQLIQSSIHFGMVIGLLYLGFFILLRDKSKLDVRRTLKTALIIEIADVLIAFNSIFLFGNALTVVYSLIFYPIIEAGILYLRYYKKDEFSVIKVVFLYAISCIPAFFISVYLTDAIFESIGTEGFVFIYQLG